MRVRCDDGQVECGVASGPARCGRTAAAAADACCARVLVMSCCRAELCCVKRYCLESLRAAVLRCTKGVWTRSFLPAACPRRNGPYLPTRMHEGMHACMHASKHQHARNARVWRTTMMSMGDDNDDDAGERLLSSWRTSTGGREAHLAWHEPHPPLLNPRLVSYLSIQLYIISGSLPRRPDTVQYGCQVKRTTTMTQRRPIVETNSI